MKNRYIVIEGNIGAGKTTIANTLARELNTGLILENAELNPFLENFYKNPKQYAYELELSLLAQRYKQLKGNTIIDQKLQKGLLSDFYISKSMLFAGQNLSEDELEGYSILYNKLNQQVLLPDIYFYIHNDIENLLKNIKKRNRKAESTISLEYLKAIEERYLDYIKSEESFPIVFIDLSGTDDFTPKELCGLIIDEINKNTGKTGVRIINSSKKL